MENNYTYRSTREVICDRVASLSFVEPEIFHSPLWKSERQRSKRPKNSGKPHNGKGQNI